MPMYLLEARAMRKVAESWSPFPKLRVNPSSVYMRDGEFWTAAGATAGIDLSLALIEEDFGSEVALSAARELVAYMKRPGTQAQYSEPLQF
jgi:transcriptional regulator GlxA family with amidase domain